jgi:macrolide-specific efflux system membrane fusion protein
LSEPDKKGQITVSVMDKNGTVTQKPVETGLNDKVMVEIRSGLSEGEKVVTGDNAGGPAVPRSNRGRSIRF